MNFEVLTADQIARRAIAGEYRYEMTRETRARREYRVYTGRTDRGYETIICHKSNDIFAGITH